MSSSCLDILQKEVSYYNVEYSSDYYHAKAIYIYIYIYIITRYA